MAVLEPMPRRALKRVLGPVLAGALAVGIPASTAPPASAAPGAQAMPDTTCRTLSSSGGHIAQCITVLGEPRRETEHLQTLLFVNSGGRQQTAQCQSAVDAPGWSTTAVTAGDAAWIFGVVAPELTQGTSSGGSGSSVTATVPADATTWCYREVRTDVRDVRECLTTPVGTTCRTREVRLDGQELWTVSESDLGRPVRPNDQEINYS